MDQACTKGNITMEILGIRAALNVMNVYRAMEPQIKSVSGDDPALCTETCDGVTNVANADHTACGKIISTNLSTKSVV